MTTFTTKIRNIFCGLSMLMFTISANASIIYNVDRTIGAGTVSGYIETDGTLGILGTANITDWVLTISAPNLPGGPTDTISFLPSGSTFLGGVSTTASSTQLIFDFDNSSPSIIQFTGATGTAWCLGVSACGPAGVGFEGIGNVSTGGGEEEFPTGSVVFASVSTVPVPAAVWLFGSGLLGLIGMARHKKT